MAQIATFVLVASEPNAVYLRLLLARETGRRTLEPADGGPLVVTDAIELWRADRDVCLN